MPKLKTNRAMKKRVRVTAKGKFKRKHAFHSHIAKSKNAKRKRQLRSSALIENVDQKEVQRLLPYAG